MLVGGLAEGGGEGGGRTPKPVTRTLYSFLLSRGSDSMGRGREPIAAVE